VVVREGAEKHDEVGTALVKVLGLSPPGTFVKLVNGETAVVMRRGIKPAEPMVACVLNRNDEPLLSPGYATPPAPTWRFNRPCPERRYVLR
jgi:hypothetical protein